MKSFYLIIFVISFCTLEAQTPVLVKDINPGPLGSAVANFPHFQIDDVIYFVGDISGKRDLYSIKDGEVEMISQICSGSCSFFEVFFLRFQNKLHFVKRIDSKFNQLWSTDGTVSGTNMILDYPGAFRSFGVGNNGKVYLSLYNRNSFKDEVYISDGTAAGTKKLSTDVSLGSDEEEFGAPIKYGNGIAFANIINDSLKLFTYDDENLSIISAIKVNKGSFMRGLKSLYTDDLIILIHSDDAISSDLYKYNSDTKELTKEISLPFERLKYPHLKDFGRDTLILYYHNGGHFLLTGKSLLTVNISNLGFTNLSADSYYYTFNNRSVYNTNDNQLKQKIVLINKDLSQKKILDIDLTPTDMIGYEDHAFNVTQSSSGTSGKITLYYLTNQTSKPLLNINNQSFSTNGIKALGLLGSKLYFLANLNQTFGKELYFVETGIPTSTNETNEVSSIEFKIMFKNNIFKIVSEHEFQVPLNVGIFDYTGKFIMQKSLFVNSEYQFDINIKGLCFAQIRDQKFTFQKAIPFIVH